jgi:hypothetical protein
MPGGERFTCDQRVEGGSQMRAVAHRLLRWAVAAGEQHVTGALGLRDPRVDRRDLRVDDLGALRPSDRGAARA